MRHIVPKIFLPRVVAARLILLCKLKLAVKVFSLRGNIDNRNGFDHSQIIIVQPEFWRCLELLVAGSIRSSLLES